MYQSTIKELKNNPKNWLVTGAAGFIGSHLVETLLKLDQKVTGLDNFSTGYTKNIDLIKESVSKEQFRNFSFMEADIRNLEDCQKACENIDYVLHQAALGSVPRSIEDPITTNAVNIDGFLNMLTAARDAAVKRFVYAASSSTYGDSTDLPKKEDKIGNPLSPYAVTKYANELYADVFSKTYFISCIGLRYFNIFGSRQDPNGAYAAVIPKWFAGLLRSEDIYINGDGQTTRDFCYIENCVQANILAACTENKDALNTVYNIAVGENISLNDLFLAIKKEVVKDIPSAEEQNPIYRDFRAGDVRHSLADISKARNLLGYNPSHNVHQGILEAADWYKKNL